MASVKVVDVTGAERGVREVSDKVFDAAFNPTLVHDVIVALQSNQRQGTHKTKTRSEVSGGGIKPFRQKGTGRARRGSSRDPLLRGGGTIFGPVPRSYRQRIPIRSKRQAVCCMLSDRLREDRLSVLEGLTIDAPKTKPVAQMLASVAPEGRKTLIVTAADDKNLLLSARNIPNVTVRTAAEVSALDVISVTRVILQAEAVSPLEERLS